MEPTNERNLLDDPRLTAYALGEDLDVEDRAAVEGLLERSEPAREELEALRAFAAEIESACAAPGEVLSEAQRDVVREHARTTTSETAAPQPASSDVTPAPSTRSGSTLDHGRRLLAAAGVLVFAGIAATLGRWTWNQFGVAESEVASFRYGIDPSARPSDNGDLAGMGYLGESNAPASKRGPSVIDLNGFGAGTGPPNREQVQALRALGYGGGGPSVRAVSEVSGYADVDAIRRRLRDLGYSDEQEGNTESYDPIRESRFTRTDVDPRATFSVDVDTASYANVRRFIRSGQLPPPDAVRIEELLNYFPWDDADPTDGGAFAVTHQVTSAPWKPSHRLVRIGVQAREVAFEDRESANLVFLLDVSGSMNRANKLPLLVSSLAMLVEQLRSDDRIAIVAYAGSSGLVLPSTACANAPAILEALERLSAGGSTNGGAGIELAYRVAREHFVPGGINRVVLATDGDFNVGVTDRGSLVRMIEREAESGVQLTALGFGMGNLKDDTLELLTNKGDGNYAYVDSLREAHKVLVEELGGTLVTVARDTKLQVEWNPAEVGAWRLLGYENRRLQHQDFEDDTVDAAEVGSGHHVTVLFELVPPGQVKKLPDAPPLRYQQGGEATEPAQGGTAFGGELGFFKLRHLQPNSDGVGRVELPLFDGGLELEDAHPDLAFAAAVAGYGLLLSRSEHAGDLTFEDVFRLAQLGQGADPGGYRADFVLLALEAQLLARQQGWEQADEPTKSKRQR